MIDKVGGGFRHAPRPVGGAKATPLAGKRDQLLVGALGAAQAQKPVREDAALEKGIELVFDKLGQGGPALGFDLHHETLDVFLDQPKQGVYKLWLNFAPLKSITDDR